MRTYSQNSIDSTLLSSAGVWVGYYYINNQHFARASRGGGGSVVIKAEANEEFDTRSGKITFTSGYKTFTITVVQSPKSAIILEKDSFEVGKDGGTITVVVKTTVGFETVVPREYSEWIGIEPYTKALETRYVQLNIARNKGAGRTGYVDLVNKEKGLSKRVSIKQEAGLPAGPAPASHPFIRRMFRKTHSKFQPCNGTC